LAPGKHSVTVTDSKACKAEASTEISENILALEVRVAAQTAINCNGAKDGALQANVSGGKGPYTYTWSAKGLSDPLVKGLAAGDYSVSVSDASGKTASTTFKLEQPTPIQVKINVLAPASTNNADGKATAQASGGTGAFSYKWDNGETLSSASKLSPGTHTLSVTDAKGCTSTANVDITENILPLLVELEEKSSISCFGVKSGAILAKVQGGKAPYRFQWSDPNTKDEAAIGLSAGNYSLTVTDGTGAQKAAQLSLSQPEAMSLSLSKKYGVTAETAKDGLATLQVKGGTGPLKYAWSTGETLPTAQQLGLGKNAVTVTDANGCTAILAVDINKKNIPELTAGRIRNGQAIRVEQLQFDIDSINIKASFRPILDEVFEFLTDNPGITVEVGGHTNGLCQDEFCVKLSTARAKSVAEYLINKGIEAKRVLFKGYGRTIPIATNSTPEGRQKNQRVEIKIVRMNG
jgi:outer membrane protein OmpA-like peptidoglycan-associated protein